LWSRVRRGQRVDGNRVLELAVLHLCGRPGALQDVLHAEVVRRDECEELFHPVDSRVVA